MTNFIIYLFPEEVNIVTELSLLLDNISIPEENYIMTESDIKIFICMFEKAYFITFKKTIEDNRLFFREINHLKSLSNVSSHIFFEYVIENISNKYKLFSSLENKRVTACMEDLFLRLNRLRDLNSFVSLSLLHIAVLLRDNDIIGSLLIEGADINKKDKSSKLSPLSLAIDRNLLPQVKHLINLGAEFDEKDLKILFVNNDEDMINYFLSLNINYSEDILVKSSHTLLYFSKILSKMKKPVYALDILSKILESSQNRELFILNEDLLINGFITEDMKINLLRSDNKSVINFFKVIFKNKTFSKEYSKLSIKYGIESQMIFYLKHNEGVRDRDAKIILSIISRYEDFNIGNINEVLKLEGEPNSTIKRLNKYLNELDKL